MNTTDFLAISSAICPEREAVVFEERRTTYDELAGRVGRLASALNQAGLKKGDILAVLQVNCPEYIETYFACARLGIILQPLNFRAKQEELFYLLDNSKAKALVIGKRYFPMLEALMPRLPHLQKVITLEDKLGDFLFYEDLIKNAPQEEVFAEIDDEDITVLMYTAGTTGRPKGVPLRHSGFVSYVLNNVEPASPDVLEKNLLTMPLYHIAAMQSMLAAIYGGRTLVLMRQFEVNEWLKIASRERVDRVMLVPTMLKDVMEHPDFGKHDLSSIRVITYGGAPMPFEVIKKAIQVFPHTRFINAYGQTETASTIAALGPEDHIIEGTEEEKEKKMRRLSQSIGRALPDVQIKIVDDSGKEVPRGTPGYIVAKGERVMQGYWQDEEKSKQLFTPDGFLITKDRGWMDEEGYIYLMGRDDDIIIRGGENIAPGEIENALDSHPAVKESAVIGAPDARWGEVPVAVVVLKEGQKASEEELIQHCRGKIASFKCPQKIYFVPELPKNTLGKVVKKELRARYAAG